MDELTDRHVVVVGAGRGLGRAVARELASLGASLTLVSRTASELEQLRDELAAEGREAWYSVGDATDAATIDAIVEQAAARRPLWGCVVASGTNRTGVSTEYSLDDFDLVMRASAHAAFIVCTAVGRSLLHGGNPGRIVTISSQMGLVGYPGRAAYCAAKHAVNGLTKALAVEWAPHDITVNAVAPTFVETPMTESMLADPAFRAEVLRRIPRGRLGELDEVASAVAYLMSPRSSLVTGHVMSVDGGWVAW